MIIYSLAAGGRVSIAALFLAGVIPAVILTLCIMVAAYGVAVKRGYPKEQWPGWKSVVLVVRRRRAGAVRRRVIIIGGILSGMFTATESARSRVIYALLVTVFVYRSLTWENFWKASTTMPPRPRRW